MFEFVAPWLIVLLPVPYLVWRFVAPAQKRSITIFMSNPQQYATHDAERTTRDYALWVCCALWALFVLAAMRPLYVGQTQTIEQPARDVMLAVDISGSMGTQDMRAPNSNHAINRLQAVRIAMHGFIEKRDGDRLGLILFGDKAYLQTPLTLDTTAVWQFLQEATIGLAGKNTAIGDAIGLATKKLANEDTAHAVIILLTDGADTASSLSPQKAADIARKAGIKIYTIGMMPNANRSGIVAFLQGGNNDLDEGLLQKIASTTGGLYFRASNWQQLSNIYSEIDALETISVQSRVVRPEKELYYYPLACALLLFCAALIFWWSQQRRQTINSL